MFSFSNIRSYSKLLLALALIGAGLVGVVIAPGTASANGAGINKTINFQGRLLTNTGAVVPDGSYNMRFKVYQDGDGTTAGDSSGSPTGTLEWTELWQNSVATGSSAGVTVKNGYFSVNLGTYCAFVGGSCQGNTNAGVNFDYDTLWVSMDVGGTVVSNTPTYDGEMLPMKRLASAVYALQAANADNLGGLASSQYVQLAQGIQSAALTSHPAIGINATSGTQNLVTLQSSATDVFDVTATGNLQFGNNADKTISIAQAASSNNGNNLTIQAGSGNGTSTNGGNLILEGGNAGSSGTGGGVVIKPQVDNTAAFSVENSAGSTKLINVDSTNLAVSVGTAGATTINIGSVAGYIGYNAIGPTQDTGDNNLIAASQWTAPSTGTLASMSTYIGPSVLGSPYNQYQLAIYADNGSNVPGAYIASSTVGTLTPNAWNTLPISASLTAGTNYWLVVWSNTNNGADNAPNFSTLASSHYYAYTTGVTFGYGPDNGFPAIFPTPTHDAPGNYAQSTFASYSTVTGPAVNVSATGALTDKGAAIFEDSANSTTAFQVQNAAGASLFTADTTNSAIVLGQDTIPASITVRGGAASGVNVSAGNITLQASDGTGAAGSGSFIFQTASPTNSVALDSTSYMNGSGTINPQLYNRKWL